MKLTFYVHRVFSENELIQIKAHNLINGNNITLKEYFVRWDVMVYTFKKNKIHIAETDFDFLMSKVNQISDLEFELKLEFICNA